MLQYIILFLCAHHVCGVQTFYTSTDANTFGDFALGAGYDINRFEPKASHVFKESNDDLLYDIMPVTSTKTRCAMISRTKDMTDNLHVHGALSVSYKMISGSGHVTFDQKKETMSRVAYYTCTVDRTLFTISVNTPDITDDWDTIKRDVISNNLIDLNEEDLQQQVGDYHIKSITYGRRYTTEIQMVYTSDDAFERVEGKLKAEIGMGALSVTAEVEIEKEEKSWEEDLTLKVSSEALGFIEEQPLFLPRGPLTERTEDGEVTLTVQAQIEDMVQKNLAAFNRVDQQGGITAKTKMSKEMLFAEIGDAYPLWYAVDTNYPYFEDTLTALSPFQEENMLRHLDQAYDILRELQDMQENIEHRADLLFDSYHLLSGATPLSRQFLNHRQDLMGRILRYRTEVTDYLKQKPNELAELDVYGWASAEQGKTLMHISVDLLHTDVWDLLGMEDVPMQQDHNPIGATCLFNGIQATEEEGGIRERKKFAGRVVFGSLTVRHVLFDVDGRVVSLGYIDHEHDYQLFTLNRCNQLTCAGTECPWDSKDAILLEVNFRPRHGTALESNWSRNQYTMKGTYYYASRACSTFATSMTKLSSEPSPSVYACEGTWTDPGVQAGAARLCGDGWTLCGYDDLQDVDSAECNSIPGFYASQVSSNGFKQCQMDGSGTNDIWGCGNQCSNTATCGTMSCIIGKNIGADVDNWEFDSFYAEKDEARAIGSDAGVLCCASHDRAPEACTSIQGARWAGKTDTDGCFWHGTGYTESQCMSLCSIDTRVANCHIWMWAINGSCRHWGRCAGQGDSDYDANQDGWVGGICPETAFEYEIIPEHIGCNDDTDNFGYLGRPSRYVNGVVAECLLPSDECVALGRRTCNTMQSCWGFAYNSGWGVQLYSSHAADSDKCTGDLGLKRNADWTVYRKYQLHVAGYSLIYQDSYIACANQYEIWSRTSSSMTVDQCKTACDEDADCAYFYLNTFPTCILYSSCDQTRTPNHAGNMWKATL